MQFRTCGYHLTCFDGMHLESSLKIQYTCVNIYHIQTINYLQIPVYEILGVYDKLTI